MWQNLLVKLSEGHNCPRWSNPLTRAMTAPPHGEPMLACAQNRTSWGLLTSDVEILLRFVSAEGPDQFLYHKETQNESHHSHHITPSYVHTHMHAHRQFFLMECREYHYDCSQKNEKHVRLSEIQIEEAEPVWAPSHPSFIFPGPWLALWADERYRVILNKRVLTSTNTTLRQQHQGCLQHDFRKAGASRSASLQTYAVQKMIVQSHRTLF